MKKPIIAVLCAIGMSAFADYSLLDYEHFVRPGEFKDKVVWGNNPDGTKNVTLIQDGADEVQIASEFNFDKYAGKDGEFPGWNLEYRSDTKYTALKPGETGDRLEVMKKQWAKNPGEKPYKPQVPVEVSSPWKN